MGLSLPVQGSKYRPKNRLEATIFISYFCSHCVHDIDFYDNSHGHCPILQRSKTHQADKPGYPDEIIMGPQGWTDCTAFELNTFGSEHQVGITEDMFV